MLNIPRFVGGLKVIVLALLSFFIVSTAILLGFTAAFRMKFKMQKGAIIENHAADDDNDTMECKCRQSFEECMYKTLKGFFSGGDVVSWMDIAFGIIAVLIVSVAMACICSPYRRNFTDKPAVLNILQYIVTQCGHCRCQQCLGRRNRLCNRHIQYIGDGGLRFLSEHSLLYNLSYDCRFSRLEPFFSRIDNMNCLFLSNPKVCWSRTQHPYCVVKDKEKNDNPGYYLTETEAKQVEKAKSFETDLYWLSASESSKTRSTLRAMSLWLKWLQRTLFHVVLVAIGFALFGVFLPTPYREKFLSFGSENEESVELAVERLVNENMKKHARIIEAGEREGSKRTVTGMAKVARPVRFQSV